jgi:hypothetical protein
VARRVVLGTRPGDGDLGLFVSPPGQDAGTLAQSSLLFSTSKRRAMLVESGVVVLGGAGVGVRRNYSVALTSVPLVFCGLLTFRASDFPVIAYVDVFGFTAFPVTRPDGATPAAGAPVPYYVWMRNIG